MAGANQSKQQRNCRVWKPEEVLFSTYIPKTTGGSLWTHVYQSEVYTFLQPDQLRPVLPSLIIRTLAFSVAPAIPPACLHVVTDPSTRSRVITAWQNWLHANSTSQ